MKIAGRKIQGPNVEIIPIPRLEGDIIFQAQAIMDWDEFEKMVPEPKMPQMIVRGKGKQDDPKDKNYLIAREQYAAKRMAWMVIKSLQVTPDLEWETVNYSDSTTWVNYEKELADSGFSVREINRIVEGVWSANCLDESKIEEARRRFLAGREKESNELSSPNGEQVTTPSGEPAKD